MVDIIKLDDLTLDEIKSRIISLNDRFKLGKLRFDSNDTISSDDQSIEIQALYTLLKEKLSNKIFPYYEERLTDYIDNTILDNKYSVKTYEKETSALLEEIIQSSKSAYRGTGNASLMHASNDIYNTCHYNHSSSSIYDTSYDRAYYKYHIEHERAEDSMLFHVFISNVDSTDEQNSTQLAITNYVSHLTSVVNALESELVDSNSARIISEVSDEYCELVNNLLTTIKSFLNVFTQNIDKRIAIPTLDHAYVMTIQVPLSKVELSKNVAIVSNESGIMSNKLRDIFSTQRSGTYDFDERGIINQLRRRLDVCDHIMSYELFVGRGSEKRLSKGKMSIAQAMTYLKDNEGDLREYEARAYFNDFLENIEQLLELFENNDLKLYLKVTEFKVTALRALKATVLSEYYSTLEDLFYDSSSFHIAGLERPFKEFERGEITQNELKAKFAKYHQDIDELEAILTELQQEFNDCLAECAKIIEGE